MKRGTSKVSHVSWLLPLLISVGAWSLRAQNPRDSLIDKASGPFVDAGPRAQMLVAALNPGFGPPSGRWAAGVQLLAQTLIEQGQDATAAAWLRWALRLSDFPPDTVNFLRRVVAEHRAARVLVARTTAPGDSVTRTTWEWPAQGHSDSLGTLRVAPSTLATSLKVIVEGAGTVPPGGTLPLSPGSYEIVAVASSYDTARVTREVLPGVATVVGFSLRRSPAAVATTTSPASPQATVQSKKKGFPWAIALLGVGGAAGLVVALGGHGGGGGNGGSSTGGITFTFPNP